MRRAAMGSLAVGALVSLLVRLAWAHPAAGQRLGQSARIAPERVAAR